VNLCWVFATIRAKHPVLATTAGKLSDVNEQMQLEGEQNISSITWAFAVLQMKDRELFQCAGSAANKYMHEFTMQGVATVAWAFASVREQAEFIPAAMSRVESGRQWEKLEPRGCAMLLWSLAALRHNSERAELFFRLWGIAALCHASSTFARKMSLTVSGPLQRPASRTRRASQP
jgi:hypothetical protein